MHDPHFLTMSTLFALAFPHSVFTFLFLITKNDRKLHDLIASVWILLLVFPITQRIVIDFFEMHEVAGFLSNLIYPIAYGPLAYLYVKSLVDLHPKFNKKDLLHFIPFLILAIILYLLPKNLHPHPSHSRHFGPPPPREGMPVFLIPSLFLDAILFISNLGYSIQILKLLKVHANSVENYFSQINSNRTLIWLKWMMYIFIILFTWNSFSPVLFKFMRHSLELRIFPPHKFIQVHLLIFILFSYILSFFTIRQSLVYSDKFSEFQDNSKQEKYARSGLQEKESQIISDKLFKFMETEKPYLKEDLRIKDVADNLGVTLNYLSQTLNEVIQKNFYQFVNEYRVKEVKDRLKDPKYKEHTVLRIALDCGFSSKSSFNSIFRKITSISPTEFRNKELTNKITS